MSKSNKLNLFLNTYEQQNQIDKRLRELFNCLKISDQIRNETEQSKLKLKTRMNKSFESIKVDLAKLETKIYGKVEHEIFKNQIDVPIRNLENDINQLIGNLNSLSLLKDSEKLLCIKSIDSSIDQIKNNLKSIQTYKNNQIDSLDSNQHQINCLLLNQIENIQTAIRGESINLNSECLNQSDDLDYKKWLLQPKCQEIINKLERANSFEFINFNQELDAMDILNDFDDCDLKPAFETVNENTTNFSVPNRFDLNGKNDCVANLFNNIYSKPIDYWLLSQK
ncbi:unnamed protein product [Brachionus calyciflorus]|uniref:Uncharacterized protein n=1 Tax=Brachionus calyciflorus TaxID=104777 RepID=A0A814LRF7_9BILA|nr:unnamed protein product [Brachionus calyciflorus]